MKLLLFLALAALSCVSMSAAQPVKDDYADFISIDDPKAAAVIITKLATVSQAGTKSFNPQFLTSELKRGLGGVMLKDAEAARAAAIKAEASPCPSGPLRIRATGKIRLRAPDSEDAPFRVTEDFDTQGGKDVVALRLWLRGAPSVRSEEVYQFPSRPNSFKPYVAFNVSDDQVASYDPNSANFMVIVTTAGTKGVPVEVRFNKPAKEVARPVTVEYFLQFAGLYQDHPQFSNSLPVMELVRAVYRDKAGNVLADNSFASTGNIPVPKWMKNR